MIVTPTRRSSTVPAYDSVSIRPSTVISSDDETLSVRKYGYAYSSVNVSSSSNVPQTDSPKEGPAATRNSPNSVSISSSVRISAGFSSDGEGWFSGDSGPDSLLCGASSDAPAPDSHSSAVGASSVAPAPDSHSSAVGASSVAPAPDSHSSAVGAPADPACPRRFSSEIYPVKSDASPVYFPSSCPSPALSGMEKVSGASS